MSVTTLVRIRFRLADLARLDRLTADIRERIGRRVSRAAVIRVLVSLFSDELERVPGLAGAFDVDATHVRRGRAAGRSGKGGAS
jgi:hypothetical protein